MNTIEVNWIMEQYNCFRYQAEKIQEQAKMLEEANNDLDYDYCIDLAATDILGGEK